MKLKSYVVALLGVCFSGSLAFGADPMAPIDASKYEGKIKVACVGDSITQGAGMKGNPYPKQLQEMLGEKWEVGNFGVSGRTLMDKGDFPYSKEKKYQDALAMKPDVVIIMLGTNDTKPQNWKFKDEFEADYKKLIKSFQDLESKPRIYICRACPVIGNGSYGIKEEGIQEQIPIVNKIAAELGLGIIDMYAALKDTPELIPDKVHPNAEGGGKMAAAAAAVLTGKKAGISNSPKDSTIMPEDDDKWATFETYKGPPEPKYPWWFERLSKFFIYTVGLMIVFGFCGALLFLLPYRLGRMGSKFALMEEPWMAWSRFILGGIIGVFFTVRWWKKPVFENVKQAVIRRKRRPR